MEATFETVQYAVAVEEENTITTTRTEIVTIAMLYGVIGYGMGIITVAIAMMMR